MKKLIFRDAEKVHAGGYVSFNAFDLEIEGNGVFCVLGAKAEGKSTLLRLIGGLEKLSGGSLIFIDDDGTASEWTGLDIKGRNVVMSLPTETLIKRKTVFWNLAYPLMLRDVPQDEINDRVVYVAQKFGLDAWLHAKVKELSEERKKLLTIARCFMRRANVYLFDNPLKAFDTAVRADTASLIRDAVSELDGMIIYATDLLHECEIFGGKAAIVADKTVYGGGYLDETAKNPMSVNVASMIANPAFLSAKISEDGKTAELLGNKIQIACRIMSDVYHGQYVTAAVSADAFTSVKPDEEGFDFAVEQKARGIKICRYLLRSGDSLCGFETDDTSFNVGENIRLNIDASKISYFDADNGKSISEQF